MHENGAQPVGKYEFENREEALDNFYSRQRDYPGNKYVFTELTEHTADVPGPDYYKQYDPEPVVVVRKWGLNFNLGNTIKYLLRAGKKDPKKHIEDLRKAISYIEHEIRAVEAE